MDQLPPAGDSFVPPRPPREPAAPGRWRRIVGIFGAVILGIVFVLAAAAFAWIRTEPTIPGMLPADVSVAAGTDLSWWWSAAAPLRRLPSVQAALSQFESKERLSIQNDILPWAGQGGMAVLSVDKKAPQAAVFVQVRDWIAFARFLRRVESRTSNSAVRKIADKQGRTVTYDGIPIVRQTIPGGSLSRGSGPLVVESAMLHGWYAIGLGAGTLEQVIDAYTGKKPSLASNAAWLTAQHRLPNSSVGWSAFRLDKIIPADKIKQLKVSTEKYSYLTVLNFTAPSASMRWDAVSIPISATATSDLQKLASSQTVQVTPASLQSVPNDAVATVVASNATGRLNDVANYIGSFVNSYSPELASQIKTQVGKLGQLTGLAELSLVVQPSGGLGASAFADAATPQQAGKTEAVLTTQIGAEPISPASVRSASLPVLSASFADSLKLVTDVQGNRVELATNPALLSPAIRSGAPYLDFPAEASGATWLAAGNFRFLAPLRRAINNQKTTAKSEQSKELLDDAALDNAQWVTWARTDLSGKWQQQTTLLTDWQWRAALDRLVTSAIKMQRSSQPQFIQVPYALTHRS